MFKKKSKNVIKTGSHEKEDEFLNIEEHHCVQACIIYSLS